MRFQQFTTCERLLGFSAAAWQVLLRLMLTVMCLHLQCSDLKNNQLSGQFPSSYGEPAAFPSLITL